MKSYWITFEDGTEACCEGQSPYDARLIAEKLRNKKVKDSDKFKYKSENNPSIQGLPYPASPSIWKFKHPIYGETPSFCHDPKNCKGKSSCPKSYSCTE